MMKVSSFAIAAAVIARDTISKQCGVRTKWSGGEIRQSPLPAICRRRNRHSCFFLGFSVRSSPGPGGGNKGRLGFLREQNDFFENVNVSLGTLGFCGNTVFSF
jgi:hypothetical protein